MKAVLFFREEDVEACQCTVAAGDVTLQFDLQILRDVGAIDLLFEHAQPIP